MKLAQDIIKTQSLKKKYSWKLSMMANFKAKNSMYV